jgi:hypothetical protein
VNIKECNLASPVVSGVLGRTSSGTTTPFFAVAAFENGLAYISVLPLLHIFSEVLSLCSGSWQRTRIYVVGANLMPEGRLASP